MRIMGLTSILFLNIFSIIIYCVFVSFYIIFLVILFQNWLNHIYVFFFPFSLKNQKIIRLVFTGFFILIAVLLLTTDSCATLCAGEKENQLQKEQIEFIKISRPVFNVHRYRTMTLDSFFNCTISIFNYFSWFDNIEALKLENVHHAAGSLTFAEGFDATVQKIIVQNSDYSSKKNYQIIKNILFSLEKNCVLETSVNGQMQVDLLSQKFLKLYKGNDWGQNLQLRLLEQNFFNWYSLKPIIWDLRLNDKLVSVSELDLAFLKKQIFFKTGIFSKELTEKIQI